MRASHRSGGAGAFAAVAADADADADADPDADADAAAADAGSLSLPSANTTPRNTETPLLKPAEALLSPATTASLLPPARASTSRALG